MSAKSDTKLPGFMHNEIRTFWITSKNLFSHEIVELMEKLEEIKKNIRTWVMAL